MRRLGFVRVGADAAQLLGHGERAKADFGAGLDDLPIPRLATAFDLVAFERCRQQHRQLCR